VIAHNVETVERLQFPVRDRRAGYEQSLSVLEQVERESDIYTKTSIMLGHGEYDHEVYQTLADLRERGVDIVTLGRVSAPVEITSRSSAVRPSPQVRDVAARRRGRVRVPSIVRAGRWSARRTRLANCLSTPCFGRAERRGGDGPMRADRGRDRPSREAVSHRPDGVGPRSNVCFSAQSLIRSRNEYDGSTQITILVDSCPESSAYRPIVQRLTGNNPPIVNYFGKLFTVSDSLVRYVQVGLPVSTLQRDPDERVQVLDEAGRVREGVDVPDLTEDELVEMYEQMRLVRRFDERAVSLQRQGRMGTYPPLSGQESRTGRQRSRAGRRGLGVPQLPRTRRRAGSGTLLERTLLYWMGHEQGNYMPEDVTSSRSPSPSRPRSPRDRCGLGVETAGRGRRPSSATSATEPRRRATSTRD